MIRDPLFVAYGPLPKKNKTVLGHLNNYSNDQDIRYSQHDSGRDKLRAYSRRRVGKHMSKSAKADSIAPSSSRYTHFLDILNQGGDLGINRNDGYHYRFDARYAKHYASHLTHSDIKRRQNNLQVWFDKDKFKTLPHYPDISAKQLLQDIQSLKAGKMLATIPSGFSRAEKYLLELERLSSYVVMRGEVLQTHLMDKNATVLETPRERVLYFTTMPKLQFGRKKPDGTRVIGTDLECFIADTSKGMGNCSLEPVKIAELKEKIKDVLRLNIQVAAVNNEGYDIVTPNAFFSALKRREQDKAKNLFFEAIAEVAKEPAPMGFQGLFVHHSNDFETFLNNYYTDDFQIPVVLGKGDASAPQLAASGQLSTNTGQFMFNVAEAIMSEGIGAVGNGYLSDRANRAKEENDTRVTGGTVELVFSGIFNHKVFDKGIYNNIHDYVSMHPASKIEELKASESLLFSKLTPPRQNLDHVKICIKGDACTKPCSVKIDTSQELPDFHNLNRFKIKIDKTTQDIADLQILDAKGHLIGSAKNIVAGSEISINSTKLLSTNSFTIKMYRTGYLNVGKPFYQTSLTLPDSTHSRTLCAW